MPSAPAPAPRKTRSPEPPSLPPSGRSPDAAIRFIVDLARALHRYGTTAHRLENALQGVAHRLGLEAQFFSTPTAVFLSAGLPDEEAKTVLIRVQPEAMNLERLALLDGLATEVMRGEVPVEEAAARIAAINTAPQRYGRFLTLASSAMASATAARFFGGGWREIVAGGVLGLLIGLLGRYAGPRPWLGRLFEPMAAALASFLATFAAAHGGRISVYVVTLSALITLVPGLSLTVAMSELSTRDLSSGSARLANALMIFLALAFGVAFGGQLASLWIDGATSIALVHPVPLPAWTEWVALLIAPLGFVVLLRASPRDIMWILIAGATAYFGVRLGARALGPQLGAFAGAVAVGAGSNLYARFLDRPAAVTQVPGILFLVPGSIGFKSLAALLDSDVVSGIETAFRMTLVAIALVAGLLVSNVVVPPRKAL